MGSGNAYGNALPLKKWQQKALFGDKFFSKTELMIFIEIKTRNGKITYEDSAYYQREFYTAINRLEEKGIVKKKAYEKDKRKRIYELVNNEKTKYIFNMIFGGIMVNESPFKEIMNEIGLTPLMDRFLDNYTRMELCLHFNEICRMLGEELEGMKDTIYLDIYELVFDRECKMSRKP